MLTHVDEDNEQRILLADFGIARDVDDISGLTTTDMAVGTVAYCALRRPNAGAMLGPAKRRARDVERRLTCSALTSPAWS